MHRLPYRDLRRLTSVLPKVHVQIDLASLPGCVVNLVPRFVAADLIEYNEVCKDRCQLTQ